MHPLPKRTKQTHHKKRQIPHHQPPTIPMQTLPNIFHGNQRHTPIPKTPNRTTNNKHMQTPSRKKRHKKHRTTHRTPQRHHKQPPRGDMAEHATKVNDYLMKNVDLSQLECDELWTFIKKKRENTTAKRPN